MVACRDRRRLPWDRAGRFISTILRRRPNPGRRRHGIESARQNGFDHRRLERHWQSGALVFVEEGADVHLVARDAATLAATADELRDGYQANVTTSALDLSDAPSPLQDACPAPDILVNNAGAIPPAICSGG